MAQPPVPVLAGPLPAGTPVLVIGATGQVGRQVVAALLARGATVRALLRDPEGADVPAGVARVRGDLRDPASLRAALRGAGAAFYVSPHEADERALAAAVVAACEAERVRLVFVGVHVHARSRWRAALLRVVFGRILPHYRGKIALARDVARSPLRPVMLVPANFMQNDEVFAEEIRAGRFVTPLSDRGVNRVDLRDVGEAAARALLDGDVAPGSYDVAGPRAVGGRESAAVWAEALGRPVAYLGDDDELMARTFARYLDGQRLADWTASFRVLRRISMPTSRRELRTTRKLLGREPRSFETYVHDTVAAWRAAGLLDGSPATAPGAGASPPVGLTR
ncbi:NAD-dependent epimerase/dehydratase family protein [Blastococcus sp. MG754426]|uniref:SDR family oxidoreductase n=1 Tax=unclassified Blastococcus TaxID=2619396 RepID=UPI001EF0E33E|nr:MULTISPECIES: NmrA family NAD(P)-binding protein [unclassified Blastococcus]MCF6506453.1 NAD-dependent epimerase/dehydratase family protein [Blastococcus sp. MG754426]MCF6511262.1 NAD-dependent epimerase/dehydratase family protein [Blastococcus sp. MG754427]